MDSAVRCSLLGLARGVPASLDLLPAAARLGGAGVWMKVWRTFLSELNERQQLKWSESFVDGSFAPAEKRGCEIGKTKRGKGTN
jgi:hypothetical protein